MQKPHAFIKTRVNSSMFYTALAITFCLVQLIMQYNILFYEYNSLYFSEISGLADDVLINTIAICETGHTEKNRIGLNYQARLKALDNLTPHMLNYNNLHILLCKIIESYSGSAYLNELEPLSNQFLDTGHRLLNIYT